MSAVPSLSPLVLSESEKLQQQGKQKMDLSQSPSPHPVSGSSTMTMKSEPLSPPPPESSSSSSQNKNRTTKRSPEESKKNDQKEIITYEAPWEIYGMSWSTRQDQKFRLAIGSFVEEYNNKVEVVQLNEEKGSFEVQGGFDHPYPTTKIMWLPDKSTSRQDLLATTGDYLRVWKMPGSKGEKIKNVSLLNNSNSEFCAPLTSFDWNEVDPAIIGTSSIDTTCTIWNIETQQAKTQLIAHDKEVYDIAFTPGTDQVFASAGADGSVRMFDLRSLEHSTIIYESPKLIPLLRLGWNKLDHKYLATFLMERNEVVILDIRAPSTPVAEIKGHSQALNAIAWAPHSSCHLCTAGDDKQALIWDLAGLPKPVQEPILAYNAKAEINSLQWCKSQPEWVSITFQNKLQVLRV